MLAVRRNQNPVWPVSASDWMDREMSRMMRSFFDNGGSEASAPTLQSYPVDVWEDDDSIYVEADLPGFKKEEIDVTLERGTLQISAQRTTEEKRNGANLISERRRARYFRSFSLPTAVDDAAIEATYENGVLRLTLPKSAEVKPRRIDVK